MREGRLMSGITIEGLEELVERIVDEKVRAALPEREPNRWLTSQEAAEYLGLAVATIHDLVNDGRLPRHGEKRHRLRFRREDLDAYAEGRRGVVSEHENADTRSGYINGA